MPAPDKHNSRSPKDIVGELVHKVATIEADDAAKDATEADIRATIRFLREVDRKLAYRGALKERTPNHGLREENENDIDSVLKQIKSMQKTLKKVFTCVVFAFF